ncbi:MFS transporter [Amycolatopsis orientalis]|uniref:MFS transporter n=1 Tax=Amycolatopsis orientalis TaxID=31958 RepID=UPI00041C7AB9|nr:MFS transporter [Amycolatopsis orientalis]
MVSSYKRELTLTAAGLSLIAVSYGLARYAYGLFAPALRAEFGLDGGTLGTIASGSYVAYCLAVIASTAVTARWGARAGALAAGTTATAGTALIAAAPNAAVLAVGVVLAGASTGLASPSLADAVSRVVRANRRDRAQAVVNAGTGLGVLVSGPVSLLAVGDWRLAWWAFAAASALVTAWIARVVPPVRERREHGLPVPLFPPSTRRLLPAAATLGLASAAVWTFGRDIAVSVGGLGETESTVVWIVLGAVGLAGAFTAELTSRAGLRRAWSAGMILFAAATALFALATRSLPALIIAAALFGAVYIGLTGVLILWGTRAYPGSPAFGVGVAFLLLALGQAAGAPLIGFLGDLIDLRAGFLAAAAMAVLGLLFAPTEARATYNFGLRSLSRVSSVPPERESRAGRA